MQKRVILDVWLCFECAASYFSGQPTLKWDSLGLKFIKVNLSIKLKQNLIYNPQIPLFYGISEGMSFGALTFFISIPPENVRKPFVFFVFCSLSLSLSLSLSIYLSMIPEIKKSIKLEPSLVDLKTSILWVISLAYCQLLSFQLAKPIIINTETW